MQRAEKTTKPTGSTAERQPAAGRMAEPEAPAAFADQGAGAIAQRELLQRIAQSPREGAMRPFNPSLHDSPRMVAQRRQLRGNFGGAVQLQGGLEDEEPVQGRLATAQRLEGEADVMGAKASDVMRRGAPSRLVQARRDPLRPDPGQESSRVTADGRAPVQRVLSHTTPIVTGEVDGCQQLSNKVWKLTRANGENVIIKFELMSHQTPDEFEERAHQTMHLANLVLQGVPGMTPIAPADIVAINGIDATAQGKTDAAGLQQQLANPAGIYVYKAQTVNVGDNLQDMVDNARREMKAAKGKRAMGKALTTAQDLAAAVMNTQMMTSMGRMAAFDLIVNNYDRFRPDGTANLTNLDIGGGVALGIDNLNPNDRLLDPNSPGVDDWEAGPIFHDAGSAMAYAMKVVDFLAEKTAYANENLDAFYSHFSQGFFAASRQMRDQSTVVGVRRNDLTLPLAKRQVAKFIYTRLNAIPF
jgi:hypothetical protein